MYIPLLWTAEQRKHLPDRVYLGRGEFFDVPEGVDFVRKYLDKTVVGYKQLVPVRIPKYDPLAPDDAFVDPETYYAPPDPSEARVVFVARCWE